MLMIPIGLWLALWLGDKVSISVSVSDSISISDSDSDSDSVSDSDSTIAQSIESISLYSWYSLAPG